MPHPDEALIHAWLDGELDAAEAARVEAFVARDADWASAAAEARGLIAASSRIVGALDHVNANVIPREAPTRRAPRWWMARIAALLVLVAGTAVVLREGDSVRALRKVDAPPAPANTPAADAPSAAVRTPSINPSAPATPARARKAEESVSGATATGRAAPAARRSGGAERDRSAPAQEAGVLADAIPRKPASPVDSTATPMRLRGLGGEPARTAQAAPAGGAAGERLKTAASFAAPAASAPPVTSAVRKDQALDRAETRANARANANASAKEPAARTADTRLCFEVRQGTVARRLWKLDSAQVADSVRLLTLDAKADTLRNASTGLTAVRTRCPEP